MTYEEMIQEQMAIKPSAFQNAVDDLYALCKSIQMAIEVDDAHQVPASETFLEQGARLHVWLDTTSKKVAPPRRM